MFRASRRVLGSLFLVLMIVGAETPTAGQPGEGKVSLEPIKYSDLGRVVRSLRGKVIVVDFWADF
jgi:hypothetical protein